MKFTYWPLRNETFKSDHIKRLITLTSDYIKRLSLYLYLRTRFYKREILLRYEFKYSELIDFTPNEKFCDVICNFPSLKCPRISVHTLSIFEYMVSAADTWADLLPTTTNVSQVNSFSNLAMMSFLKWQRKLKFKH